MGRRALALLLAAAGLSAAADLNIPFEKYKLKNGMRVILSRDNAVPVATIYVIYDIGARAEEKGRTGFAHLFEHMMFQGSANAPKGLHFKTVESNGGVLNGSTHPDFTDYYELLPSNKLAVGLWLESDRMKGLNITPDNLTNQKEAVKQERRLSFDNRPYNTAIVDKWPEVAFRNFSNFHSLIGSYEDLNAATVEDVSKFFKTNYAPNNAVMVIVGDFQIADAKKLVDQYFSGIEPQPQPKRPDLTEPAQTEPRSEVYMDKLAKVPAVILGFPGPERRSPDFYALSMLDVIFTGGQSSRFQQNLVKGKKSVIQYEANLGWPFASGTDYRAPGHYAMFLLYNPSFNAKQIAGQVQQEIDAVIEKGIPNEELERARVFLRASRIRELQSTFRRAAILGQYEVFDGNPGLINTEMEKMLAVTGPQIQAAAKKYLQPQLLTTLAIQPDKSAPPAPPAPPAAPAPKTEGAPKP